MRRSGWEFKTYEEACCFIAAYGGTVPGTKAHDHLVKLVPGYMECVDQDDAGEDALRIAIRMVCEHNGVDLA